MCGLCGLWQPSGSHHDSLVQRIAAMSKTLRHRGPDDDGIFADASAGIALGHRRLSVVDLSPEGHQPMMSSSGRYVIVFNGEIYNHGDLRSKLESVGYRFRGNSDTEVLMASIEHWGINGALERFIGMFAFALWDKSDRTLTLARDRLGIKPLYYGWSGSQFVFASELKALVALPRFANGVNRDALGLMLRHGYIPAPYSIYHGIRKLKPGTWLRVDHDLASRPNDLTLVEARTTMYWSALNVAERGTAHPSNFSDNEATDELDRLLRDAVRLRMQADVPLGTFLSGGIDSSAVVSLMQAQSMQPVKTFTIGFRERPFDEAPHAKAVATHLGTDHHELYASAQDALDVIPRLPNIFDEPFADASQIPTFLVSQLARTAVTVSLSGDGGDELFAGYSRYFEAERYRRWTTLFPYALRRRMAQQLILRRGVAATAFSNASRFLPRRFQVANPSAAAKNLAAMLMARTDDDRYLHMVTRWHDAERVIAGCNDIPAALTETVRFAKLVHPLDRMMFVDQMSYLPDDCLTKVDRCSMAVGLEARVPLLDHRVVEFAWSMPLHQKIRRNRGKWLLREVLNRYVPRALVERPKMGFGVPIGQWLRGPLREWADTLLDEQRLREEGYFDAAAIRNVWKAHLQGTANEQYRLWSVLMFQAWLERTKMV